MRSCAPPGPTSVVGICMNVTEAGDDGVPVKTSCPADGSVAAIVFGSFCVTDPNERVLALVTVIAALTVAVARTVDVAAACASATPTGVARTSRRAAARRFNGCLGERAVTGFRILSKARSCRESEQFTILTYFFGQNDLPFVCCA